MNWKPTWVMLTAAAVVFAFIALVEYPIRKERLRQSVHLILPGLNPTAVTNIEIQPWGQPAIRVQRGGPAGNDWRLTQPIAYPAQSDRIEAFLASLLKLEWKGLITDQELKDRPNAQEQYGFTQPRFSILVQGAGADRRLEVGDLSPMGDEVFLNVVGSTAICLADSVLLQSIPREKDDWRDHSLLRLANIPFDELTVRSAARELDFRRDPENHLWYMKRPVSARADTAKVNNLLVELSLLPISRFASDDPKADLETFGLQSTPQVPYLTLAFSNGASRTAVLEIGASPTNQTNLAYARRQDTGNIVLVAREPFQAWQGDYTNFLDQHFISLSPSLIQSIETRGQDDFVVRKDTNGHWQVQARESYPADAALMQEWLATLTNIQTAIVKTVVADFTEYGLADPVLRYAFQFGTGSGTNGVSRIEFGTNKSGQVFERRTDEDFVNTISRDDFARLPRVSWEMRDRSVWSFESSNVVSVTIHQLGATRKFLRDPDGNWTFAPGYHGPPNINSPSLEEGVYRIGKLTAVFWDGIGDDASGQFGFTQADHNLEFEVKGTNGVQTLRIEFGGRSPYSHTYAAVVRSGQRLIFEFPADLFENFVEHDLIIPAALRFHQ